MAKLIWSRNMTRDRLHESEDKRKDLIDFYDYDELLETLDDDQVDDLIDSDERMPAMDNAYYDEDVRPKIEAQTLDGIVLLVERPEEEEEPEEEPAEEEPVKEDLDSNLEKWGYGETWDINDMEEVEEITDEVSLCEIDGRYFIVDLVNYDILDGGTKSLKKAKALAEEAREMLGESLNEEDEEEAPEEEEVPEVDDDLPELEGLAILADEIPEEFPDAKIVDDGDGFVLEDGDTKYDMYAIPEDKVEEFMDKCMDDPMEDVMDEDEEFESDMELDVDSINDNCDFSMVPEVCERITGEPKEEEEPEEEPEEGEEELEEATLKPENKDSIVKEAEELKKKADEYGIDYFTAMPFSEYDNDPISFEHQFPNVAKIWRSFMKEVLDVDPKDDDQIDEIWDTDIDQTDWNTVMKVIDKMVDRINKNGESTSFQITKEYTNQANANKKDNEPKDELVDDEYSESLDEAKDYFIDNDDPNRDTALKNANRAIKVLGNAFGAENVSEVNDIGSGECEVTADSGRYHQVYTFHKDGSVDERIFSGDKIEREEHYDGMREFIYTFETDAEATLYDNPIDEAMTITEAPYQDEYGYMDDDAEGITPDEAKEDIDDFLEGEISIEAFRDFDNDDKELGKEEWIRQMIEFNFDADDLVQDWYENYSENSVEKIENEARDYFDDKARALLSQVWDHYAGVKEDLITDSEPSAESVDPDDNLTESDAWPWGDPGPLN